MAQALHLYRPELPQLSRVWADGGYSGMLVEELREQVGRQVDIVKRSDTQPKDAWAVQPPRWLLERTLAWLGELRRLSRDDEYLVKSSESLIYAGTNYIELRRMTWATAFSSLAG